jgi:hypothetical protein
VCFLAWTLFPLLFERMILDDPLWLRYMFGLPDFLHLARGQAESFVVAVLIKLFALERLSLCPVRRVSRAQVVPFAGCGVVN